MPLFFRWASRLAGCVVPSRPPAGARDRNNPREEAGSMRSAIISAGNVGSALGRNFAFALLSG
jgi:hypothetical protein